MPSLSNAPDAATFEASAPIAKPAARPKTLVDDAFWTLAGNVTYSVCLAGWMVLISKLCSADSRGRYVLAVAAANPIIAFAALGLRQMLATDVRHEHKFSRYLGLRIVCLVVAMVVMAGIAWTQPIAVALMIVVVGLSKSIEQISDIVFGRIQQFGRFDRLARCQIIKGVATLACLGIGVVVTRDALGAAAGAAAGFLLTLVLFDLPTAQSVARSVTTTPHAASPLDSQSQADIDTPRQMWDFVVHAAPLAFATTLVAFNLNMAIYFLHWCYGSDPKLIEPLVGTYGALNYLPSIGAILMNAVGVAAATRLAAYYSDGKLSDFYRVLSRLLLFCAVVGGAGVLVAAVAGQLLISIFFTKADAAFAPVLVWLMVAGGIANMAGILGYAVTATRKFRHFILPYLAVTIVGLLACWLLISGHDLSQPGGGQAVLRGAAWATALIHVAGCLAPIFILVGLHWRAVHAKSA
jgi:O-antigen/teichoic acid export membrane protein